MNVGLIVGQCPPTKVQTRTLHSRLGHFSTDLRLSHDNVVSTRNETKEINMRITMLVRQGEPQRYITIG